MTHCNNIGTVEKKQVDVPYALLLQSTTARLPVEPDNSALKVCSASAGKQLLCKMLAFYHRLRV